MVEKEGVETVIDRMVDLVQGRGRMSLHDVAVALGISEPIAEEIANVLAEQGMLKVVYKLTGTFIEPKSVAREEVARSVEEVKKREEVRRLIVEAERELAGSEKSFRIIEADIMKRLEHAERVLERIEAAEYNASEEEVRFVLKEARELEKEAARFGGEVGELKERLARFSERVIKFEARTKGLFVRAEERRPSILDRLLDLFRRRR